jgi:hypothetical protein
MEALLAGFYNHAFQSLINNKMKTALELFAERISSNSYLTEWMSKIKTMITDNGYGIGEPEMTKIAKFAATFLDDYHQRIHSGHLTIDNQDPTEQDINNFVDIIIAIMVDRGIIMFENLDSLKSKVRHELLKHYYASSETQDDTTNSTI